MGFLKSYVDPSTQAVTAQAFWKIVDVELHLAPRWASITVWVWYDKATADGGWNPIAKLTPIVLRPDEFDKPIALQAMPQFVTLPSATEGFAYQLLLQRPEYADAVFVP
jgi:hypothetical protein